MLTAREVVLYKSSIGKCVTTLYLQNQVEAAFRGGGGRNANTVLTSTRRPAYCTVQLEEWKQVSAAVRTRLPGVISESEPTMCSRALTVRGRTRAGSVKGSRRGSGGRRCRIAAIREPERCVLHSRVMTPSGARGARAHRLHERVFRKFVRVEKCDKVQLQDRRLFLFWLSHSRTHTHRTYLSSFQIIWAC